MGYLRSMGLLAAVFVIAFVLPVGAASTGTTINFSSLDKSQTYQVSGTLYFARKQFKSLPRNCPDSRDSGNRLTRRILSGTAARCGNCDA